MWNQLPLSVPVNNSIVWVRIDRWSGTPFLALYDSTAQSFTSQTNSIVYPAWMVSAWKSQ